MKVPRIGENLNNTVVRISTHKGLMQDFYHCGEKKKKNT